MKKGDLIRCGIKYYIIMSTTKDCVFACPIKHGVRQNQSFYLAKKDVVKTDMIKLNSAKEVVEKVLNRVLKTNKFDISHKISENWENVIYSNTEFACLYNIRSGKRVYVQYGLVQKTVKFTPVCTNGKRTGYNKKELKIKLIGAKLL